MANKEDSSSENNLVPNLSLPRNVEEEDRSTAWVQRTSRPSGTMPPIQPKSQSARNPSRRNNSEETDPKTYDVLPPICSNRGITEPKEESHPSGTDPKSSLTTNAHRSISANPHRGPYDLNPDEAENNVKVNANAMKIRIEELEENKNALEIKYSKLENKLKTLQTHCNGLQTENVNLQQRLTNMKSDLDVERDRVVKSESNRKLAVRSQEQLHSRISRMEEQLQKSQKELKRFSSSSGPTENTSRASTILTSRSSTGLTAVASAHTSPTKTHMPSSSQASAHVIKTSVNTESSLRWPLGSNTQFDKLSELDKGDENVRENKQSLVEERNELIRELSITKNKLNMLQQEFACLNAKHSKTTQIIDTLREVLKSRG